MLSNILLMLPNFIESERTFDVDGFDDDNFLDDDELEPSNFVILLFTLLLQYSSSWNFLFRFFVNNFLFIIFLLVETVGALYCKHFSTVNLPESITLVSVHFLDICVAENLCLAGFGNLVLTDFEPRGSTSVASTVTLFLADLLFRVDLDTFCTVTFCGGL